MNSHTTEITAAISYIESHLDQRPSWTAAAKAASYSKYHFHRSFTQSVGIPPHTYIRRRQLTEAARQLVFSQKPILEIALTAGYESQQAFASTFKAFYKQTPLEYRRERVFYPLQLEFDCAPVPSPLQAVAEGVSYATEEDIAGWMPFLSHVIAGFPRLDGPAHLAQVRRHIRRRQLLIMRDGPSIIGAAAFSRQSGTIPFLAIHPQYRHCSIADTLLGFITCNLFPNQEISITTFRQGDRADIGQRAAYRRLGFVEAELLTEFGYPVQRLILPPSDERSRHGK